MTQNKLNTTSRLMQFVSTSSASTFNTTTILPRDDTIPQNTEGDEIITLAITPKSASSKLVITFTGWGVVAAGVSAGAAALFQDTTAGALSAMYIRTGRAIVLRHVMTSGTTSSTTFKIRCGPNQAGSFYLNANATGTRVMGGVSKVWLTIEEYL